MSNSISDVKFKLQEVYKTYADQLFLAGGIADIMLDNSNIPASGGQVEGSLRILLAQLLPERITVSQGHIVDKSGSISNQQDVLIAESFYTKSLIRTLDGTEFYPYECIFANGEVKKKWNQKHLSAACKSIQRIKESLLRQAIPANYLATGSSFVRAGDTITSNPFRNPLFSFAFALDYDSSYSKTALLKLYKQYENWKYLPNITVVLNQGIYVLVDETELKKGDLKIKLYPEFVANDASCSWVFVRLDADESLAYLVFMLIQHINDSVLEKASTMEYGANILEISISQLEFIK